jgi:hypothetical protein
MAEQDLVSLGYDLAAFSPSQKIVLEGLEQTYATAMKLDGLKIAPGVDPSWKALKATIEAQAQSIKKLQDANVAYIKTQEALTKADTALIKQMQEEEKLLQQEAKTRKLVNQEAAQSERQKQKEEKATREAGNAYIQLNKQHQEAIMRYRVLALTQGEQNAETLDALRIANEMGATLKRLDANLGIHNRNVGNYKSAFDGLGMSFTQVARELPSLTISFQQFALAISNNLPMVQDELAKARKEIAALRAEGKETPSLLSRIGKSLLSWQVGLSVGIAIFTAIAKPLSEWVVGLFDASKAQEKAAMKAHELNKAYLDLIKTQRELDELLRPITGAERDLQNQLAYAKEQNQTQSKLLGIETELAKVRAAEAQKEKQRNTEDAEFLGVQISIRERDLYLKKQSYIKQGLLDDEKIKNSIDRDETEIQLLREKYNTQKAVDLEYFNAFRDLKAIELRNAEYFAAEQRKLDLFTATQRAEIQKRDAERTLSLEESTQQQRLDAIRKAADAEKAIARAEAADVTNNPSSSKNDKIIAAKELSDAVVRIDQDTADKQEKVREDYRKRRLAAENALLESELALQDAYNELVLQSELASIKDRLSAFQRGIDAQFERENARYRQEKDRKGLTDKELEAIETQHQNNLTMIAAKGAADRLHLLTEVSLEASRDAATNQETEDIRRMTRDLDRLSLMLEEKKITIEEYNREVARIERNAADQSLQNQLVALTTQRDILIKGKKDTTDINNQIAQVEAAIGKKRNDQKKRNADEQFKYEQDIAKKSIELAFATLDVLQTAFTSQYENEKNRIQELIDLSDERYSKEIENIRNSTLSEVDKAARIKILEQEQAQRRREYEREIREQNIKKAKADRVFQIFQIAGNTAIGVTSALAQFPPNPILAAIIGAIGAAQIAKVIATPIPRYAEGTDNHPGGLAMYGEAGPERVKEPGKSERIVDTATVGYLAPGTQVTPLTDLVDGAARSGANRLQAHRSTTATQTNEDWAIAKYLAREYRAAQKGKQPIRIAVNIPLGISGDYINKKFGRN